MKFPVIRKLSFAKTCIESRSGQNHPYAAVYKCIASRDAVVTMPDRADAEARARRAAWPDCSGAAVYSDCEGDAATDSDHEDRQQCPRLDANTAGNASGDGAEQNGICLPSW